MSDHLLPPNASPAERDISRAIDRAVPTPVSDVWRPDACPAQLLPWLAWALTVDEWDTGWTDAQKRDVIKNSIEVHRTKGTIGAVRHAIAALGLRASVQEWFNQIPQAAPYTFRVLLEADQVGIPQSAAQGLMTLIERTKNLRSHLDHIQPIVRSACGPQAAVVALVGNDITLAGYEFPTVVLNATALCI